MNVDFGNFRLGIISGQKFHDRNGNGVKDPGEPGLKDWTIYIDTNLDGQLQDDEPQTMTDANGSYSFSGLFLGVYRVREVVKSGWRQTSQNPPDIAVTMSGQTFTGVD